VRGALHVCALTACTVSSVDIETPTDIDTPPKEPGIHFGWVTFLAAIGVVVTFAAFWGPFIPGLGDNAVAVWQSIFTNFGVGVFSAAVLLLFEPKLRNVITKTVSKTVTDEVKKDVREAVQADIEERFASLEDTISSRYDEMLATQQGLAKDLVSNFTHERVMKLFREASNLSAIDAQSITVHGDAAPDDFLIVRFQLRFPDDVPPRDPYTNEPTDSEHEALHVAVIPKSASPVEVVWEPGQDFVDVAMALAKELNFRRIRGIGQRIEWGPILARLEKGLDVAVNSSMKTQDALPLDGEVSAFIEGSQDWYLTTAGLYCPEISYHLPGRTFYPKRRPGSPSATVTADPVLEMPEGVNSETEWKYASGLAKSRFTFSGYSF